MEINNNIIAIGSTEGGGIVLLINKKDIDNSEARCVSVENNTPAKFDHIGVPMTFNAFHSLSDEQGRNYIASLNQKLSNDFIELINTHLNNER